MQAPLTAERHSAAVARAAIEAALQYAPRWTMCDTGQLGAAAYTTPVATATPLYADWQCAVLEAVRRMRRWHYYAEALPTEADANLPLDGCHCEHCLTGGASRSAWQSSNSLRIRRDNARLAARAKTVARQRRFEAAVEAALDAASDSAAYHQVAAYPAESACAALPEST
jgi:hypothetical protein